MEGVAYLLVGVEPGQLLGVTPVDDSQLTPGVETYCGRGPRWAPTYIEIEGRAVLVVTMEAPAWGDPIHPVRKTFTPAERGQAVRDGQVFVRHPARTDEATAEDIDMLSRRAARSPGDELAVDVGLASEPTPERADLSEAALRDYIEGERARLLEPLSPVGGRGKGSAVLIRATTGEYRTPDKFRESVDRYISELEEKLSSALAMRAVLHDLGLVELELSNPTDTPFTDVVVELFIPLDVGVSVSHDAARAQFNLPEAPLPYGQMTATARLGGYSLEGLLRPVRVESIWLPEIEDTADGARVIFSATTVRPQGRARLDPVWLILSEAAPASVRLRWEATGAAQKRLRGELDLPARARVWSPAELLAPSPHDNDD